MFSRTMKVLMALGTLTAAGSSSAFYVTGPGLTQSGYCALLQSGNSFKGIMKTTMAGCQQDYDADIATGNYVGVQACQRCPQMFSNVPETAHSLQIEAVRTFRDRSLELRERFHIEAYEREQDELQRSMQEYLDAQAKR